MHDKQDWEPHYDVTTTMSAKKQEDISFRTEDGNVKPETQRLRLDFNPGTYGLNAASALFGSVLFTPNLRNRKL